MKVPDMHPKFIFTPSIIVLGKAAIFNPSGIILTEELENRLSHSGGTRVLRDMEVTSTWFPSTSLTLEIIKLPSEFLYGQPTSYHYC